MTIWIVILVLSGLEVVFSSPRLFQSSVTFVNQPIDTPDALLVDDPDFTFLKVIFKFRDAVQHTTNDAIKFFNESYGLDFSLSPPNEQNEYFYQNARLNQFRFTDNSGYYVTLNNWIQTGSTRSVQYPVDGGGFQVSFSADQLLHGSYGGAEGRPAGVTDFLYYGFYVINVCPQSPVIIQYQSASLPRPEPINGEVIIELDVYNQVLGYGKGFGTVTIKPDPANPGKFQVVTRNTFTFPGN